MVIGPLADAGDDVAQLWLARWLAWLGRASFGGVQARATTTRSWSWLSGWLGMIAWTNCGNSSLLRMVMNGAISRGGWPARTRCTWFAWPRTLATKTPGSG